MLFIFQPSSHPSSFFLCLTTVIINSKQPQDQDVAADKPSSIIKATAKTVKKTSTKNRLPFSRQRKPSHIHTCIAYASFLWLYDKYRLGLVWLLLLCIIVSFFSLSVVLHLKNMIHNEEAP